MSNPALDQATAKAHAEFRSAAEREDRLQAQLDAAKLTTAQLESIYDGYRKASLIETLKPGKAAA